METYQNQLPNQALLRSLSTIQSAKGRFYRSMAGSPTPTTLASRIRLCDLLLTEIRAISCSLERRIAGDEDLKGMRSRENVIRLIEIPRIRKPVR